MPLFPTEAPAPTGKTLTEIQPAIPINAETAPGEGNSLHTLRPNGSYYLTSDLVVPTGYFGIRIIAPVGNARFVLDMNGFTIRGEDGSQGGISIGYFFRGAVIIRNGNIRGCGVGLHIASTPAQIQMNAVSIVEDLTITDCLSHGIEQLGTNAIVQNCILDDNGGYGMWGRQARVENSRACGNGVAGFLLKAQGSVRNCIANRNATDGFELGEHAPVCRRISDSQACGNGRHGIYTTIHDAQVVRCIVEGNGANGIESTRASQISGNLCRGHDNGAGIVARSGCTLEDNYCVGNQTGVRLTGERNLMRRNVCSDNATNWDVAEGNTGRVIVAMKSSGSDSEPDGLPLGSADSRVNYTL